MKHKNNVESREVRRSKKITIERNFDILGLCEARWQSNSDFNSNKFRVITNSSDSQEHKSVAIIIKKKLTGNIVNKLHVNERLLLIKIKTQTCSLIILQVYLSISNSTEK